MASYVVRVYRYTPDPPAMVGVVVGVDDQVQHVFRSQDEFWRILGRLEQLDSAPDIGVDCGDEVPVVGRNGVIRSLRRRG